MGFIEITKRLNCRVSLYGGIETETELGIDYAYREINTMWAEIIPQGGSIVKGQGNTQLVDITHKITIRANAVQRLSADMYFIFKEQRYDIKYFQPNYKYKNVVEIFCSLVVE